MNKTARHCAWEDFYDFIQDKNIEDAIPICPACKEPLSKSDRCCVCGQEILKDEKLERFLSPPRVESMDCIMCGGKDTMKFARSKLNGNKHGCCTKCGAYFLE